MNGSACERTGFVPCPWAIAAKLRIMNTAKEIFVAFIPYFSGTESRELGRKSADALLPCLSDISPVEAKQPRFLEGDTDLNVQVTRRRIGGGRRSLVNSAEAGAVIRVDVELRCLKVEVVEYVRRLQTKRGHNRIGDRERFLESGVGVDHRLHTEEACIGPLDLFIGLHVDLCPVSRSGWIRSATGSHRRGVGKHASDRRLLRYTVTPSLGNIVFPVRFEELV